MTDRITVNVSDHTSKDERRDLARWTIDLATNTARHETGLVVQFDRTDPAAPPPDVGVRTFDGWTGQPANFEDWQQRQGLPLPDLAHSLPRLMRLAGDAFFLARQEPTR